MGSLMFPSSTKRLNVRVTKPRRMCWAGHIARIGFTEVCTKLLSKHLKGPRSLRQSRRRWIILKCMLQRQDMIQTKLNGEIKGDESTASLTKERDIMII